jgi:hypothetical protein
MIQNMGMLLWGPIAENNINQLLVVISFLFVSQ